MFLTFDIYGSYQIAKLKPGNITFLDNSVYRAHRAVIFAIAQLSCLSRNHYAWNLNLMSVNIRQIATYSTFNYFKRHLNILINAVYVTVRIWRINFNFIVTFINFTLTVFLFCIL